MRKMKNSNIEWLGEIPDDWKISKIDNLYENRVTKVSDDEFAPLSVTMQGVVPQLEHAAKTDAHDARKLVCKGDFVINSRSDRRGSCGTSSYEGSVSLINTVLKPRSNGMNPDYYNWLFHTSMFASEFYRRGHGIVNDLWTTKWNDMKKIEIPVPSLNEQSTIASILSAKCGSIDKAISLAQSQIYALKRYKTAVITQAVTKGLDPNVEMKDSGVEWIGLMPQNWKIYPLKNVLSKPMKYGANAAGVPFSEELPRYIRITDITDVGTLKEDGKLSLPLEIAKNYLLKPDTILFARSGATVGKTFLYTADDKTAAFAGYLISAAPDQSKVKAKWLYYYCNSKAYWYWKDYIFTQSTIQNVSAGKYNKMPLPIASISEQEGIINYLDAKCIKIDAAIAKQNQIIEKLNEYKKSVIYNAVTGKIDCQEVKA